MGRVGQVGRVPFVFPSSPTPGAPLPSPPPLPSPSLPPPPAPPPTPTPTPTPTLTPTPTPTPPTTTTTTTSTARRSLGLASPKSMCDHAPRAQKKRRSGIPAPTEQVGSKILPFCDKHDPSHQNVELHVTGLIITGPELYLFAPCSWLRKLINCGASKHVPAGTCDLKSLRHVGKGWLLLGYNDAASWRKLCTWNSMSAPINNLHLQPRNANNRTINTFVGHRMISLCQIFAANSCTCTDLRARVALHHGNDIGVQLPSLWIYSACQLPSVYLRLQPARCDLESPISY